MTAFVRSALVLTIALTAAPTRAVAQEEQGVSIDAKRRAKPHYDEGRKQFRLGEISAALAAYQAAYHEAPLPEILFNIAQCYRQLGAHKKAAFAFKNYLELRPHSPRRAALETIIADLEREASISGPAGRSPLPPAAPAPWYQRKKWWIIAGAAAGAVAIGITLSTRDGYPDGDYFIDYTR